MDCLGKAHYLKSERPKFESKRSHLPVGVMTSVGLVFFASDRRVNNTFPKGVAGNVHSAGGSGHTHE